jgi:hypothetical protein
MAAFLCEAQTRISTKAVSRKGVPGEENRRSFGSGGRSATFAQETISTVGSICGMGSVQR